MKMQKLFMAISRGLKSGESSNSGSFKRYVGYADCSVVLCNPTAKELSSLYGREITEEPVYLKTVEIGADSHPVPQATITFMVKTIVGETPLYQRVEFKVRKEFRYNGDRTKIQVIDKYGNAFWVTNEEFKAKKVPDFKNGPAGDKEYRPAYQGEEYLVNFIKTAVNIPNVFRFKPSGDTYVKDGYIKDTKLAECSLNWNDIFAGKFAELNEIPAMSQENEVLVTLLFGVVSTIDNKIYQRVLNEKVYNSLRFKSAELKNYVEDRQAHGALTDVIFDFAPLHEYVEKGSKLPTDAPKEAPASFDPFADNKPFDNSAPQPAMPELPEDEGEENDLPF